MYSHGCRASSRFRALRWSLGRASSVDLEAICRRRCDPGPLRNRAANATRGRTMARGCWSSSNAWWCIGSRGPNEEVLHGMIAMDVLPTGVRHVLPSPPLGPRTRPLPHLSQGRTWRHVDVAQGGARCGTLAAVWRRTGWTRRRSSICRLARACCSACSHSSCCRVRAEPTLALPRDGDLQVRCSAARRHLHDAYEDRAASERLPSRVVAALPRPLYSAALLLHPRCVASALQVCEAARCRHHGHPSHRQPHCRRRPVASAVDVGASCPAEAGLGECTRGTHAHRGLAQGPSIHHSNRRRRRRPTGTALPRECALAQARALDSLEPPRRLEGSTQPRAGRGGSPRARPPLGGRLRLGARRVGALYGLARGDDRGAGRREKWSATPPSRTSFTSSSFAKRSSEQVDGWSRDTVSPIRFSIDAASLAADSECAASRHTDSWLEGGGMAA